MKIKAFLVWLLISIHEVFVYSQDIRISLDLKNRSIEEVFNKIEAVSGYYFFFNQNLLDVTKKTDIVTKNEPLKHILPKILPDSINFKVYGHQIILTSKTAPGKSQLPQIPEISGTLTDGSGSPCPGVSVIVKGTETGTISDTCGFYTLHNLFPDAILVFKCVGMKSVDIPLDGRRTINVNMTEDVLGLDEVIVVGYSRQSRVTVTGAISTLGKEEIRTISTPTLGEGIFGRTPGIQMNQNAGTPGASDSEMFIRGLGTFNATEPLFIIDGIPSSKREFMQMNPSTIMDISILKDASATAVYGVRGANGVIVVSTMRGEEGRMNIDAQVTYSYQKATKLLDFASSYQWCEAYNGMLSNDGMTSGYISAAQVEHYRIHDEPLLFPDVNWVKEILDNKAPEMLANFNISGGSSEIKYFTSLSYLRQDGLITRYGTAMANFGYDRLNLQTNLDFDITRSTRISITTSARIGNRSEPLPVSSIDMTTLWSRLYSIPPMTCVGMVGDKFVNPYKKYLPEPIAYVEQSFPEYLYCGDFRTINENRLSIDFDMRQKFREITPVLDGLVFRFKLGYRSGYDRSKVLHGPLTSNYIAKYNKDTVYPNPILDETNIVFEQVGENSNRSWDSWYDPNRYIYMESGFEYQKTFHKHNISSLLLYNQNKDFYPPSTWAYSNIPTGNIGLAGRINYDYNQQYMFEFDMGYNGSENFSRARRFGFFPSISAGWTISKYSFMKNLDFLDNLKLRYSYGKVGSDQAGGTSRFTYIGSSYTRSINQYYGYNFGDRIPEYLPGSYEDAVGNTRVTWETSRKQNCGMEISLFGSRLSFAFDYFTEYRKDILMRRNSAPDFLGILFPIMNLGKVRNNGFETLITLTGTSGSFSYKIETNLTRSKNRILFMDEVEPSEPYQKVTGHPLYSYFGYVWEGFYSEDEINTMNREIASGTHQGGRTYAIPAEAKVKPGDMKYKDLNNDGIINQQDMKVIEFPMYPQITGGLNGSLTYKNFSLSFGAQGATQVSRELNYKEPFGPTNRNSLWLEFYKNYWTPERAEAGIAEWPRLTSENKSYNSRTSTFWIRDASYIRLRRIELSYSLCNVLKLQKLIIFLNGNNLITLQKKEFKWSDPEIFTQTYPLLKLNSAGFKVVF